MSNLDDGQLKALLDEAITYKRPKDREGKSDLFRVRYFRKTLILLGHKENNTQLMRA